MSLRIRCNNCRAFFLVPEEQGGNVVPCPKCGVLRKISTSSLSNSPLMEADDEETTSVFRPSAEAQERTSSRRKWLFSCLLLLFVVLATAVLALWPSFRNRTTDPVERVAEAYLQALVDRDEEAQTQLSVVQEPPAIRGYFDIRHDESRDETRRGSFAPIAGLHRRIEAEYSYDEAVGRFTPRHPLGPAAETLDALHDAKADAEQSGLYEKIASGDPDDLFDAAEGLGQVFQKLAEGTLAPKRVIPTYKMLVEESNPPLSPEALALALDVGESPKLWNALLKRPFFTLKADGPFIQENAEVDVQVVDALGSAGAPPTLMRLRLTRFRLEGIDTSWRVTEARRILPGLPDPHAPQDEHSESTPIPSGEPDRSLGAPSHH